MMEYLMVVTGFPTIDWQAVQLYPSCSQNNIDSPFQVLRLALHLPPLVVHFLSFLRKRGKRSRCWCCKEWPEPVPHLSYLTLAGGPVDSTTLQKDHWSWGWGFPPGSTISQNCECKFFLSLLLINIIFICRYIWYPVRANASIRKPNL